MSLTSASALARRVIFGVVLAGAFAACKGDGPQIPTTFAPSGGTSVQVSGVVGTTVVTAPQVQILDAKGKGIKGLRVRWRVGASGGGVVNDSSLTDNSGVALSGGWTLGTAAGPQTLTASADGVPPVTFTAQAAPGPAANLVRISQDAQQATVNTAVPVAPSARAQDAFGNPVPGVPVTFIVASGGGTVEGATKTTDQNGIVTAGAWKLGTTSGTQIVRASADNVTSAFFTATALAGAPVDLIKVIGDNQSGVSGLAISLPPGVKVIDQYNNPVGNVPVTFTAGANSGSVVNSTVLTDPATGIAIVGSWILSAAPTQTLVATSSALPGKSVAFTASASTSNFVIDVRFVGDGGTPAVRQAFIDAALKWRKMIVGHVHTIPLTRAAGQCGSPWVPAMSETVQDVVIFARIGPIDQGGTNGLNTLAQAGPCIYSTQDFLPITGIMEFDEFDVPSMVANGTFPDVVLHEMGHVLGVGTFWTIGRSLLSDAGSAAPYFTGAAARAAFSAINTVTFSGNVVPVEGNRYPAGTRDSHWRESVFGRELMQGFAKAGGMPLSRVTVASMQDLGYVVNLGAADAFSITSPILQGFPAASMAPAIQLVDELLSPMEGVDVRGRPVTSTPRRRP